MCVVLPHILARGPLRAPVQPPAIGSFRALNPSRASKTYRRFITHKGAFGAPLHPIRQRAGLQAATEFQEKKSGPEYGPH